MDRGRSVVFGVRVRVGMSVCIGRRVRMHIHMRVVRHLAGHHDGLIGNFTSDTRIASQETFRLKVFQRPPPLTFEVCPLLSIERFLTHNQGPLFANALRKVELKPRNTSTKRKRVNTWHRCAQTSGRETSISTPMIELLLLVVEQRATSNTTFKKVC